MSRVEQDEAEVCILAGGRSTRMGRDKAQVRLGGRTLLGHARRAAGAFVGGRVRVVREDLIAGFGPVGGVFTGLSLCRGHVVVFLSCDMPFVTETLLKELVDRLWSEALLGVFVESGEQCGFPFALRREALGVVEECLRRGCHSLQSLAEALRAGRIRRERSDEELMNLNTPEELERAQALFARRAQVDPENFE